MQGAYEPWLPSTKMSSQALYCCSMNNPPAMGVLQDPSRAVRNARSVTTATRVSSWFSLARNFCDGSSSVLQDSAAHISTVCSAHGGDASQHAEVAYGTAVVFQVIVGTGASSHTVCRHAYAIRMAAASALPQKLTAILQQAGA